MNVDTAACVAKNGGGRGKGGGTLLRSAYPAKLTVIVFSEERRNGEPVEAACLLGVMDSGAHLGI